MSIFNEVEIQQTVAVILFTIAIVLFFCYASIVLYRMYQARHEMNDEWRDPPPLIYRIFKPIVRVFCADVKRYIKEPKYKLLQKKLSSAGMYYAIMPEEFVTLRYVCGSVCGLFVAWAYWLYAPVSLSVGALMFMVICVGFAYPDIWLKDKVKARSHLVEKEFPFLLDLLILSMRAGLNYSNALAQSIISLKSGPIKDDFNRLSRDLKAGKARNTALLELADRMDSAGITSFVSALNQAEETGGEIVDVLQGQAKQRRIERFQRAEAKAGQAPVKMLLPMMLFLFPLIFMLVGFVITVGLADSGMLPDQMMRLLRH